MGARSPVFVPMLRTRECLVRVDVGCYVLLSPLVCCFMKHNSIHKKGGIFVITSPKRLFPRYPLILS